MTDNNMIDLFPEIDNSMTVGNIDHSAPPGFKGYPKKTKGFNPMQIVNSVFRNAKAIKIIFTFAIFGIISSIYFTIVHYSILLPAYTIIIFVSLIYRKRNKIKNIFTKKNKSHGK